MSRLQPSCAASDATVTQRRPRRLRELLRLWIERQRGRRALSELPPQLLRDIGLDEETAAREAAKPFWR